MNFLDEDYLIEKGEIARDLLLEYKLAINDIEEGSFIKYVKLLPNEKGLKEYRMTLGQLHDLEYVKDMYCYHDNVESYIKEFGDDDEYLEDFKSDLNKIQRNETVNGCDLMEFSVFTEKDFIYNTLTNENKIIFQNYCLGLAVTYYQDNLNGFINNSYMIFNDGQDAYYDEDNDYSFKEFLYNNNINIVNKNIELIREYSYRLYKDSKAIYDIGELLDINFKEFNKIIMDI